MILQRAILRIAALLVPYCNRAEWLADWHAELWYVLRVHAPHGSVRFTLGAFRDALWMRRNRPHSSVWLASPWSCLVLLGVPAAASVVSLLYWPPRIRAPLGAHLLMLFISLAILPSALSLTFGEYPRAGRLRRWTFLGAKMVLVVAIVFCGIRGLEAHATLAGYVMGFRWALQDQRKRCPVCLRRLSHPTRIGGPARTFLEWYGTELFCTRGHGLMHVPETSLSYSAPRWHDLDPSWSSLFL